MYGDDIHLRLHRIRAEQLHREALRARARHRPRPPRRSRPPRRLRSQLGWTLVEVGLRLATPRPRPGQQPGLAARL